MKYSSILFLLLVGSIVATAQQSTQYSMYMLNPFAQHPAYAGMDNSLSLTGVFRRQWVDLPGSPSTQQINAHLPLYITSGGVGINLEMDEIGVESSTRVTLAYDYQLALGNTGILSIGVAGGLFQQSFDGAALRTPDGNYEGGTIDHRDDILPTTLQSGQSPIFEAGLFFQNERLEIGLSAKHLAQPVVDISESSSLTLLRTYFATIRYRLDMGSALALEPSVLLKTDAIQAQADFSLLARVNDNFFGGVSYRGFSPVTQDAIVILAGFSVSEQLKIAYAYDLTLSGISNVSTGTHEILLNYNLGRAIGKGKLPPIIYNPRF